MSLTSRCHMSPFPLYAHVLVPTVACGSTLGTMRSLWAQTTACSAPWSGRSIQSGEDVPSLVQRNRAWG